MASLFLHQARILFSHATIWYSGGVDPYPWSPLPSFLRTQESRVGARGMHVQGYTQAVVAPAVIPANAGIQGRGQGHAYIKDTHNPWSPPPSFLRTQESRVGARGLHIQGYTQAVVTPAVIPANAGIQASAKGMHIIRDTHKPWSPPPSSLRTQESRVGARGLHIQGYTQAVVTPAVIPANAGIQGRGQGLAYSRIHTILGRPRRHSCERRNPG